MGRPSVPVWLAAASLTVLAGCGLFGGDDDPSAAARPTTSTTTTTAPVPPVSLTVIDAGAEPRRPLRLTFTAGQRVTTTVTFDLDVAQGDGTVVDAPAVVQRTTSTVDQVAPDGSSAVVSVVVDDLHVSRLDSDLDDDARSALDRQLDTVEGLRGTGTLGADGRFAEFSYAVPDGNDPTLVAQARQLADQVRALSVPLPDQPVGLGATWRTQTSTASSGVDLRQEATYEITALDDTTVTYTATLAQSGSDQPLPDLSDGTAARLVSSRLTGRLTGRQDLGSIGADGRSELSGTQVVALGEGGDATEVDQHLRLTTTVESG